ncbi:type I restriction endonuclease subunit R [uncultured Hymenobacter sp.]|uniref:type I restriction endonuclease subunit R n=1 Tax=uncultured Hymenobacter sp. TaxID=170016 RepID=UPI0035CA499C
MTTTDTSEKGLENIIVAALTDEAGYEAGTSGDYDRELGLDWPKLKQFLYATQRATVDLLRLEIPAERQKFLERLRANITKRGVVEVLRTGISHGPVADIQLYYATPSAGNAEAARRHAQNVFSVTRQLFYSTQNRNSVDVAVFLNGLPLLTMELKNSLTKQTVADAVTQYQQDRDPRDLLFQPGRCLVHFAVDDQQVKFCAALSGKSSWFLPFNRGFEQGAGNPPHAAGLKTTYLWESVLQKDSLADLLENYAAVLETEDEQGKKHRKPVFPRYHQLEVVRRLLRDVRMQGVGQRYLIQHSAGSGKSNSLAWLAHQLVGLAAASDSQTLFDSVVVITDRRNLDKQIKETIKGFAQVGSIVGHAERSGDLRKFLQAGKKIIITTVQKFPFILDDIGGELRGRHFALLIDEAHSSQGGRTAAKMNIALTGIEDEPESPEDKIIALMEARKMLPNASYFAFTATPKNQTLELFGDPYQEGETTKHRPFHTYAMKQAIQEGFIMDVLKSYTPVDSYYRLLKKVEGDPKFDEKRAAKKLRLYVESHERAIRRKAEIMADHFHEQTQHKLGGQARAMVVCNGIARAVDYYHALQTYLQERGSPYRTLLAFSGEFAYGGKNVTEEALNGFASNELEQRFRAGNYRFLVVADKFQTGYDEPLLHTMYVDKPLAGVKAVQTLSRLNRAHPLKRDTAVLDFYNETKVIEESFKDYYQTTILSAATDPNKLHDWKSDLDGADVYDPADVQTVVSLFLDAAPRPQLDAVLDACVGRYRGNLDEDGQVRFKGTAKNFVRTYEFLGALLPYQQAGWEKLSIFLNLLLPKLPAPVEEDLSQGILETINMDSYRAQIKETQVMTLPEYDREIDPAELGQGGGVSEPEMVPLSLIVSQFNTLFGDIPWEDKDQVMRVITQELPAKVAASKAYQNAMANSDEQNARIEHDKALQTAVLSFLKVHNDLFKQFSGNPSFKHWLTDESFRQTYLPPGSATSAT